MRITGSHESVANGDIRYVITQTLQHKVELDDLNVRLFDKGFSGAISALCAVNGLDQVVIKAGPTDEIEREHKNRLEYVGEDPWLREHDLHRVHGPIEIDFDSRKAQWSAIVYRYIGGRTFAELTHFGDFEKFLGDYLWDTDRDSTPADDTVSECFRETARILGKERNLIEQGQGRALSDFVPPVPWESGVAAVIDTAQSFVPDLQELRGFREWWEEWIEKVTVAPVADGRQLHGDARFANIIVDRVHSKVEVIDFANGRHGHVFEDFARFELDLLLQTVPNVAGTDEIDLARLLQIVGYLLKDELSLGSEPVEDRSLKCLKLWRQAMAQSLPQILQPGALVMYRWFLLRECLRRTLWTNAHKPALIYTICALRQRLSGTAVLDSSLISTAPQILVSSLNCRAVYVPTRGSEPLVNEARNNAKKAALAIDRDRISTVRLMAETGHSFLNSRGEFRNEIRSLLEHGGSFRAVIYNPLLPEYLGLSASYNRVDDGRYVVSDVLSQKTLESIRGYRLLKTEFPDRIELRLARFGFDATVLLTSENLFYEPYFRTPRLERERYLFDSFEMEFGASGAHSGRLLDETFDFVWRNSDDVSILDTRKDALEAVSGAFAALWRRDADS
ncbi:phosphotransferase family protein [Glycomyces albidus]|uniref:Phosphotransferase n=1 Tax=Glycomyces albidus TaxID=2656774 RepID=A0A6L5GF37_9ACTN|nr:hypothetical protein [Glycomyces albidus]MQM28201.1 hypothetical protein [Glycomyces albidus]